MAGIREPGRGQVRVCLAAAAPAGSPPAVPGGKLYGTVMERENEWSSMISCGALRMRSLSSWASCSTVKDVDGFPDLIATWAWQEVGQDAGRGGGGR